MAWKENSGRWYYYHNRRVNGQVITEYFGAGELANLAAVMQHRRRSKAEQERQELHREIEAQDAIDRQVDDAVNQVNTYVAAVLLTNGYHQHRRQWRKKRT